MFVFQTATLAQTTISQKATITLPNGGQITGFDISWVDPYSRVYLLADGGNSEVDIVDLNNNNNVYTVGGFNKTTDPNFTQYCMVCGPNGVVSVNHIEAWAGDGPSFSGPIVLNSNPAVAYATSNCDSAVRVIDLVTKQITDTISTGGCFRADENAFDPADQVFLIANPGEMNIGKSSSVPFITLISTQPVLPGQHHQILKKINFDGTNGAPNSIGGSIEQSVYSPDTGMFYINASNGPNDVVVVINPQGAADDIGIVGTYTLNGCGGSTGLALKEYIAFIGCGAGAQFMDIRSGNIVATVPQVSGVDEVTYDAGLNLFAASSFAGQLYTIDGTSYKLGQTIPSASGAHGITHSQAADSVTGLLYMPVPAFGALCGPTPNKGCIAVFGH